jgi:hypothetical protein
MKEEKKMTKDGVTEKKRASENKRAKKRKGQYVNN